MSLYINGKEIRMTLQLISDENGVLGEFPLDENLGFNDHGALNEYAIAKFFGLRPQDMDITVETYVNFDREMWSDKKGVSVWINFIVNCWENKQIIFSYCAGDTDRIYVTLKDSDGTEIEPTSIEQVKEWGE